MMCELAFTAEEVVLDKQLSEFTYKIFNQAITTALENRIFLDLKRIGQIQHQTLQIR